jgi:16S rRNA processing protein RimM
VLAIHNFGAGDLIEVRLSAGGKTELVPFDTVHVPEVEIAAGRIVIDPPQGLFKKNEDDAR